MKIVDVIPIHKGIFRDHLTYFTVQEIKPGDVVTIPVKNREILAVVTSTKPAEEVKAELRSADFPIKKIGTIKSGNHFQPEFMAAIQKAADYFAAPLPLVIKNFVPQVILENLQKIKIPKHNLTNEEETKFEKLTLQEPDEERLSFYKSLIRESFARKTSVFFCLPTVPDIEAIAEILSRGIENYVIVLHSKLPKNKIIELWQKALASEHPILIIATPLFLSLPRRDLKTIVIDKENSSAYRGLSRPFIDFRLFASFLAKEAKLKVILSDIALRTETVYLTEKGDFQAASSLKYRTYSDAHQEIISLKQQTGENRVAFEILNERLVEQIDLALQASERFFIFSARKGLAPTTVCGDCGAVLSCEVCSSPLVLHKDTLHPGKNVFICHKCSQLVEIDDRCPQCGGWRLAVLGYGVEKVEEHLKEAFPQAKIWRLDSDSAKTDKRAKEIMEEFLNTPGGILVGTEMALYYLKEKVENTAIANIDSLFALPDFRISEKIFNLALRLKALSLKRFIIQTRRPEEKVFQYITRGTLADFYREEIADRKRFGYPPFRLLIKITREGKKEEVKKEMDWLASELNIYEPLIFPAFTSLVRGEYVMHALLKLEPEKWPEPKLLALLKNLPPSFIIKVDPDSIL